MSEFEDDLFDDDGPTLTPEQKKWLDGLKRHLKKMPEGIELLFGAGRVDAHPAGWYMDHIYNPGADMLYAGNMISEHSLYTITYNRDRIRPNSESE